MTMIHLTIQTPVAPERVLGALTDFSPRRLDLWSNIDPRSYVVHAVRATSADVTEGSAFFGGVWERAHYDWSHPELLTITVQESNAFAAGSSWTYRITPAEDGGSRINFSLHRVRKNLKGYVLTTLLRVFGRRIFQQDLEQTLKRLAEVSSASGGSSEEQPAGT